MQVHYLTDSVITGTWFCVVAQYLGLDVDLGSFAHEQGSHVCVALLGGQMERSDTLLRQNVGLSSVL